MLAQSIINLLIAPIAAGIVVLILSSLTVFAYKRFVENVSVYHFVRDFRGGLGDENVTANSVSVDNGFHFQPNVRLAFVSEMPASDSTHADFVWSATSKATRVVFEGGARGVIYCDILDLVERGQVKIDLPAEISSNWIIENLTGRVLSLRSVVRDFARMTEARERLKVLLLMFLATFPIFALRLVDVAIFEAH